MVDWRSTARIKMLSILNDRSKLMLLWIWDSWGFGHVVVPH
jgi:hypothetical protein